MPKYKIKGMRRLLGRKVGSYKVGVVNELMQRIILELKDPNGPANPICIEIRHDGNNTHIDWWYKGKYYKWQLGETDVARPLDFMRMLKSTNVFD